MFISPSTFSNLCKCEHLNDIVNQTLCPLRLETCQFSVLNRQLAVPVYRSTKPGLAVMLCLCLSQASRLPPWQTRSNNHESTPGPTRDCINGGFFSQLLSAPSGYYQHPWTDQLAARFSDPQHYQAQPDSSCSHDHTGRGSSRKRPVYCRLLLKLPGRRGNRRSCCGRHMLAFVAFALKTILQTTESQSD